MPEFSVEFAESLVQSADLLTEHGEDTFERRRTVLYQCLLASEIALKAILEKAGVPLSEIVRLSHRLDDLMHAVGDCEVPYKISENDVRWIPATNINAKSFRMGDAVMTVGQFLTVEGASRYPTEVRYGERVVHFPPDAALKAAKTIIAWARENWDVIRRRGSYE
jgi:hypothetical protein